MRSEPEAKGRFQHPLLVALLTAVVTIPLTGLTTRWIEQAKSADALAVAHQTERRGALRLAWSMAEQYALAAITLQSNANIVRFARGMHPENPVAQIFLKKNGVNSNIARIKLEEAETELAKQRLLLSNDEIAQLTAFLANAQQLAGQSQQPEPDETLVRTSMEKMDQIRASVKATIAP